MFKRTRISYRITICDKYNNFIYNYQCLLEPMLFLIKATKLIATQCLIELKFMKLKLNIRCFYELLSYKFNQKKIN